MTPTPPRPPRTEAEGATVEPVPRTKAGRALVERLGWFASEKGEALREGVIAVEAEAGPLDEAWRAAEAALPEGWSLSAGSILNDRTHGRRVVYWAGAGPLPDEPDTLLGGKATPAAALLELAERLRALGGHHDTPD